MYLIACTVRQSVSSNWHCKEQGLCCTLGHQQNFCSTENNRVSEKQYCQVGLIVKLPPQVINRANSLIHSFPEVIVCRGTGPLQFLGKLIYVQLSCSPLLLPWASSSDVRQAVSLASISESNWTCRTPRSVGIHHIFKFSKEPSTFSCKIYIFPNENFSSAKLAYPSRKIPNHL